MEYSRVKYASFDDLLLPFHRNRNRPVSCVVDRVSCVKEFIQGWLYGVLDNGESGIFPCEYVAPLGKQEAKRGQRRELESLVQSKPQQKLRRGPYIEDMASYNSTDTHMNGTLDRGNENPAWIESKMVSTLSLADFLVIFVHI
ncbi:uncharacterized protein TNIN_246381 [Trichonephila inaurata madagascariensis]|uniref:Uncharacterized protein n=1 Tax=Trichonephila inaurata madagascariensis TaxID=2747483 RepID=A0A8X6YVK5_9ARAC|nr:uncharacterized protein TNIN_246381 [Trichonephila inaurata madagascariensis]